MTTQIEIATTARRTAAKRGSAQSPSTIDHGERSRHIRTALEERLAELQMEHDDVLGEFTGAESGALAPDAGDDVADIGTKTFAREQEIALANSIRVSMDQVERALERLTEGRYGSCESCGESIPAARLAAFPSATLCVGCKQRQERH
jgi:DnaK suppressor protein